MRDTHSAYSLDRGGIAFASKVVPVIIVVFGGVQYGTEWATSHMPAAPIENVSQVATVSAATPSPSHPFTIALEDYERTLSARGTGSAAFDTLLSARTRLIGIKNGSLSLIENDHVVADIAFPNDGRAPTGLSLAHAREGAGGAPETLFSGCIVSSAPQSGNAPCITVTPEEAEQIAQFTGPRTAIFVVPEERVEGIAPDGALPRVSASAFIVADLVSGTVYAERDATRPRPIASISKLFTALVARETIRDDRTMTVTRDDQSQTEGVPGSIRASESFTVDELLYPLLMESNNSAAYTLARYEGGEQFIKRINQKTAALGMSATTLDDPSGLSANNVSSPRDLVTLLRHINDYHSIMFDITGARTKTLRAENGRTYTFTNFNHFAGDEGFVGGKTGFIAEAGQTYAGVFDIPTEAGTSTIAIVVLGSEDRKKDTAALLSWYRNAVRSSGAR